MEDRREERWRDRVEEARMAREEAEPERDDAEQLSLCAADLMAEHGIDVPEDPYAGLYGDEPTFDKTGGDHEAWS